MRGILGGLTLAGALLLAGAANAATMNGAAALSFAAQVGSYSPDLNAIQKSILGKLLAGQATSISSNAPIAPIRFHVTEVHCQLGNVDLTKHSCVIAFNRVHTSLNGAEGNNILATMALAGVEGDGAAGTIHYDALDITCRIDVAELKSPDGGGAACTYKQPD